MDTAATGNKKANILLAKYEISFGNNISLVISAKEGLKAEAIFDFMSISRFSTALVEQLLNKTIKTFTKYKEQDTRLDATVSEKLLKLFALYDKGAIVFGSIEEFNKWLAEPAFGLGNQVPQSLLDTISGIELVGEELTRIEYGDLA